MNRKQINELVNKIKSSESYVIEKYKKDEGFGEIEFIEVIIDDCFETSMSYERFKFIEKML